MAYIVTRSDGRYEIRESSRGESGPRTRSLATFNVLDRAALRKARANCRGYFDAAQIVARAKDLGVPTQLVADATDMALGLLAELRDGARVAPGVVSVLKQALPDAATIDSGIVEAVVEWAGKSDRDRADAVVDLMLLGEKFPNAERKGDLKFPPIRRAG